MPRDVIPLLLPWARAPAWSRRILSAGSSGSQGADFNLSLVPWCLLAGRVLWFYVGQLAWPAESIFIYPRRTIDPAHAWQWLFPLGALALLGGLLVWRLERLGPLAQLHRHAPRVPHHDQERPVRQRLLHDQRGARLLESGPLGLRIRHGKGKVHPQLVLGGIIGNRVRRIGVELQETRPVLSPRK